MAENTWTVQRSIEFALDLEDNESRMGEQAALHLTCAQYGIEPYEFTDVMLMLPDGNWWEHDERLKK